MWHVETDVFALAVFLIMLIKEAALHRERIRKQRLGIAGRDIQSDAFYFVLILSIASDLIDIVSSIAMNIASNWWFYQISMTIYVVSMPLLAAVWVGYAYVLIHQTEPLEQSLKKIAVIMIPYAVYSLVALSNPFTSLFFRLSETIEYERGILFIPVGVGFIMLYSAIGFFLVLYNRKKISSKHNVALLMVFFAITAWFTCIQLVHSGWLIINASYAVIYIWCDITVEEQRRKELYRELEQKNAELQIVAKKAEAATSAKSEFLSRMSHDIRTPMNAITGLIYLAKNEKDMQVVQGYLQKMEASSKFLLGLINDILDMSKIENGEMTLNEGPYTREEFSDSIQTVIKPLIDERKINFIFEMRCGIECISVDRLRFNQIFFNLLSNAAKFTPAGGTIEFISESIEPKPGDDKKKAGIRFYVRDNGIGMSEEFQKHLYDPFIQEKSELYEKTRGTGLGLPIVKSLVDAMNGTIEVKSAPGKGTQFKIELYVGLAKAPDKMDKSCTEEKSLKGIRVLLVEDNELNTYVARTILEKLLCEVDTAQNGSEAVEKFEQSEEYFYNAILMDVHMPVMNGLEATRKIRTSGRRDAADIPIIAMTADAFDKEKKETLEAGMTGHMAKPIDPAVLYEVLSKYQR